MHLNYNILILLILVVGFVLLVTFRKLYFSSSKTTKDTSMKASNKITRAAEAIILLCIGLAIFIFTATNTSTGGRLLTLDQYQKGFAITNVVVAAVIFVGVLIAIGFVYFKNTSLGAIIAAVVLSSYGMILNGPEQILESLAPEDSIIPGSTLTFILSSPDTQGGELWVNGVHLGTLPYETTFDEFYEKVPFWPDEPNENKLENRDSWLATPNRWNPYDSGYSSSFHKPWTRITIPEEPEKWGTRIPITSIDPNQRRREREDRTYYARVKLGDEWGYSSGGSGSDGGGGGRYDNRRASVSFGFIFQERENKIEKLLDMARLNDYSPKPEWFKTMETYNSDGWVAVRKAMEQEPGMSKLLDNWTTWKYDLNKVTDDKSAWAAFKHICKEADLRQTYLTSDVAGRAVEMLVPNLDPKVLIQNARKIISSAQFYSWVSWKMNGRTQFGVSYSTNGLRTGASGGSSISMGGGSEQLSSGDFAVAHAIWIMDELLDSKDDSQPNIIEKELVPYFIAYNYDKIRLLQFAAQIGGPDIEEYFLRQNWRVNPDDLPWGQTASIHGRDVNGWLYLLANLKTPTGEEFRRKNANKVMEMADLITKGLDMTWESELNFVFLDNSLGEKSFAYKYWPKFRELISRESPWFSLKLQYEYLVRMEPLSKIEMYVECWKGFNDRDETDFYEALQSFKNAEIPLSKRKEIYSALLKHINKDVSNIEYNRSMSEDNLRKTLNSYLKSNLLPKNESD